MDNCELQLPGGKVLALHKKNIIHARGIRYAEATRFKRPSLIKEWEGTYDCTKPAPICTQNPSRLNAVTGDFALGRPMDESNLNLTVTAPAHAASGGSALPVVVWFHGGAFLSGGGDLDHYNAEALAMQNVVVVTVTYRLGIFGWLRMNGTSPANLGLMDQIEALRWVQKQISGFGGNPQCVTVAGQSAGAISVYSIMVADGTEGLFQRAILQSAPFVWVALPKSLHDERSAYAVSLLGGRAQTATPKELLEVQIKVILDSSRRTPTYREFFDTPGMIYWPEFGHYPLPPESEVQERFRHAATKIPMLISWTANESIAFMPMLNRTYPWFSIPLVGSTIGSWFTWLHSMRSFVWPSRRLHREILCTGGSSATFEFKWAPSESPYGAVHCIDLPLLFGSWDFWQTAPMLQGSSSKETLDRLGYNVKALWGAFIAGNNDFKGQHFNIDENFEYRA